MHTQSIPTLCDPRDGCPPAKLLCAWDFPREIMGVGCHFLLCGIFPTQRSNAHLQNLLYCRRILYCWATSVGINFCLSPDNFLLGIYTFFLVQFFHFPAYSYFATKATWCLLDKLQTFQLDIYIECSILYCTCFFPVYSSYKRSFAFSKSGYSISLCSNTFSLPWKVFNLVCLFFRPQLIVSWNFLSVLPDRFRCLSIFSYYVLL